MEMVKIEAYFREGVGKEKAKKVRKNGDVPAVVYSKDINVPVTISAQGLKILREMRFSESMIINMEIVNEQKKDNFSVMIKDMQYHPLTEQILHIDFMKVSLEEKIKVHVLLNFKGEPKGVKEGAALDYILREIEIEAYPLDIPEKIDIDISNLEIGHSIHVRDVIFSDNLKVITHAEDTIAALVAKTEEKEEAVETGEAVSEGPEVIKEKKKEEKEEPQE